MKKITLEFQEAKSIDKTFYGKWYLIILKDGNYSIGYAYLDGKTEVYFDDGRGFIYKEDIEFLKEVNGG